MYFSSLKDRVVIVTGAGRGFGRLIALALLEQGARVVGTAARAADELRETEALAKRSSSGAFLAVLADVSDAAACENVVAQTVAAYGRVDALINNAARGPMEANPDYFAAKPKFWDTAPDAYRRMVEANLIGAFFMARAVTPKFVAQRFGRIVNLSTSGPTMIMQGGAAYGATKAGLEAATAQWAKDLDGTGVTANVLLPGGPADTALIPGGVVGARAMKDFRAGKDPKGVEGRVGGLMPASVIVPPALWLCADESSAWNGRRFVAKDWDDELPWAQAAANAASEAQPYPRVI
jgi:NAD(P)-dependent dehydrogenase (short-subunit alcohol dehydrogenase family)